MDGNSISFFWNKVNLCNFVMNLCEVISTCRNIQQICFNGYSGWVSGWMGEWVRVLSFE